VSEETATPDNSFFKLRCWRSSREEHEFIHNIYSANFLTPRERRTLGVYHSATYLHLHATLSHHKKILDQVERIDGERDEEARAHLFVGLESECEAVVREGWSVLDSLAHEINLVCWKQAGRKDLYHPYVQEKKISFYMVRQKMLASEKLRNSTVCQLLDRETRNTKTRAESYILLSNFAMRALHRPLLLGCRLQRKGSLELLLTESEGLPQDKAFNLQDVNILSALEQIQEWLEKFIDQVYLALSAK